MKKIIGSKIIIYAFFIKFVLFTGKGIISPLIPLISEELGIGLDYIGSIISLSVIALFFVSLTTGNLIEVIGLKKVIYIGFGLNLVGSTLLFYSNTFPAFVLAYFIMRLGIGMIAISILCLISTSYPKRKTSSLLKAGFGNTTASIISPLLVSLILLLDIGWRYYYLIHPIFLLILALILWKTEIPRHLRVDTSMKKLFSANKKIITNPAFIICGMIILFYASVMNTFRDWFTSYFTSINIGIDISSLFLSIFGLAIFFGMLLRNKLIQHFKKKRLLFFSFIISFFLLLGILLIDNIVIKVILIFLFGVAAAGNFTLTFTISSGILPKYTNTATGITVAFANAGVIFFQYLTGYMSEHISGNSMIYINTSLMLVLIALTAILNYHKKFQIE